MVSEEGKMFCCNVRIDGSWKVVSHSDLCIIWLVFFIYEVCCSALVKNGICL